MEGADEAASGALVLIRFASGLTPVLPGKTLVPSVVAETPR